MIETEAIVDLVQQIKPLLAGKAPEVQGAILADLVAIHLAGRFVRGDGIATKGLREELLRLHVETVRNLIPPNAKEIGTDV